MSSKRLQRGLAAVKPFLLAVSVASASCTSEHAEEGPQPPQARCPLHTVQDGIVCRRIDAGFDEDDASAGSAGIGGAPGRRSEKPGSLPDAGSR
jgi:hypothetical protein